VKVWVVTPGPNVSVRVTVKIAATVPLSPSVTVRSLMDKVVGGGGLTMMPICPPWIVGVAVSLT
jgi:hypothetical protein